jgi:CRP-like cAMP-binding protein
MMTVLPRPALNRILASLSAQDAALLQPHLKPMLLPLRKALETKKRKIEHVYFIERGIASIVANAGHDHSVEVGLIGCEGMTGLSAILGIEISPHAVFMQSAGSGFRMAAADLGHAMKGSITLREALLHYCHTMMVQMAYTALANGRYKVDERLARWLLMALDRSEGDTIHLTHDFLSTMLGCRRPSVTESLSALVDTGAIRMQRGVISVRDRAVLEDIANGSYGAPEAEYRSIFPAAAVPMPVSRLPDIGFALARR